MHSSCAIHPVSVNRSIDQLESVMCGKSANRSIREVLTCLWQSYRMLLNNGLSHYLRVVHEVIWTQKIKCAHVLSVRSWSSTIAIVVVVVVLLCLFLFSFFCLFLSNFCSPLMEIRVEYTKQANLKHCRS